MTASFQPHFFNPAYGHGFVAQHPYGASAAQAAFAADAADGKIDGKYFGHGL